MMTFTEINERIFHYEEELESCVSMIKGLTNALQIEKNDSLKETILNEKMKVEFFCFVTTCYIDLLCTYRNLKRSKSDWEKFYNTKIAFLIAYETINTYHKYKREVYKLVKGQEKEFYNNFFDMLNRELADFKEEFNYEDVMPKIRNKATAHYEKDFLEYYSNHKLVEDYKSKDIVRSFMYFINPLHYFTSALMNDEIDEFLFVNSWMS